ncbi:MAG: type II toxin-antitoxin system VapC family toxin [Myxococcota bacterium]|jgi:predicted nucleic acid-binding protein
MLFVDTNILVAHFASTHEFHLRASLFLDQALVRKQHLVISPQVIGEAFVVATSQRIFKNPASPHAFRILLDRFMNNGVVNVVSPGEQAVEYALEAADERNITSARFFDLLIYGTMREHGISRIATFNVKDFAGLAGIELVPVE